MLHDWDELINCYEVLGDIWSRSEVIIHKVGIHKAEPEVVIFGQSNIIIMQFNKSLTPVEMRILPIALGSICYSELLVPLYFNSISLQKVVTVNGTWRGKCNEGHIQQSDLFYGCGYDDLFDDCDE